MKILNLQKICLLPNSIKSSIFLFNGNKCIKLFTAKKSCYFFLKKVHLKLNSLPEKKVSSLTLNFMSNENRSNLINFFSFYVSNFQKINRKKLIVKGLGYRINFSENNSRLEFKLGYSHIKSIMLPNEITDYYLTKNSITIESFNLSWLGNFVTRLKNFKTPDIYKGKGLHIKNQKVLILKPIKKK